MDTRLPHVGPKTNERPSVSKGSSSWLSACLAAVLCVSSWAPICRAQPAEGADKSAEGGDAASAEPKQARESTSQPDHAACLAAHAKAQELKRKTRFIEAQEQLYICSSASCPGPVIADCGGWIEELDQRTPSLAFSVKVDGVEASNASVTLDDEPVVDQSGVLKVDPGRHVVRAQVPSFDAHEEVVFARDGAGTQVVQFQFQTPKPIGEATEPGLDIMPQSEPPGRPVPTVVYPLLGLSAAGLASFGVFALIGNQRKRELERDCEPDCTDNEVQPMKNAYAIGDVSLAVGAASLLTAGIVYLARPSTARTELETDPALSVVVHPVIGARSTSSFGVVAVQTW